MAALPVTPMPAPELIPKLSQAERVVDTFIAPSKTFADVRRSASWWLPFLLLAIVGVGYIYVVDQKIGFRKVTENQIQSSPKASQRIDDMPAAQRNVAIETQAKWTRNIAYGFFIFLLIWNIVVAAILFATFKFGASADAKSRDSYVCQPAGSAEDNSYSHFDIGGSRAGFFHAAKSRGHESGIFSKSSQLAFLIQPGNCGRYFHDLDADPHRDWFFCCRQSKALNRDEHRVRMVHPVCRSCRRAGRRILIMCDFLSRGVL